MKKYLVGGAVRDKLLGLPNEDFDYVVVGSSRDEMLSLGFTETGDFFPVFRHPETGDEYALARKEKKVGEGHQGFSVEYDPTVTLQDDLGRRDLTINAMAFDADTGQLVDHFGGEKDLRDKVLRHVGPAFAEDPLRVVRLARFYARFQTFEIANETIEEARRVVDSGEMDSLSNERYWAEMRKTFEQTVDPDMFFHALWVFGAFNKVKFFKDVFGEVSGRTIGTVFPKFLAQMRNTQPEDKLDMFVSLTASEDATQSGPAFPLRIQKLTANLRWLRNMEVTPEALFEFLQKNRGWEKQMSSAVKDVIDTTLVSEEAGEYFPFTSMQIALITSAVSLVSAEDFLHLSGKEIGLKLAEARLASVKNIMRYLK